MIFQPQKLKLKVKEGEQGGKLSKKPKNLTLDFIKCGN
jgi:hypothetical protein